MGGVRQQTGLSFIINILILFCYCCSFYHSLIFEFTVFVSEYLRYFDTEICRGKQAQLLHDNLNCNILVIFCILRRPYARNYCKTARNMQRYDRRLYSYMTLSDPPFVKTPLCQRDAADLNVVIV